MQAVCGLCLTHGSEEPLDAKVRQRLQKLLGVVDDHDTSGTRLNDDAARLWRRVRQFLDQGLINPEADLEATELACHALMLPMRQRKLLPLARSSPERSTPRAASGASWSTG